MSIKKAYQEVVEFLQENSDKKVKSIINEVIEMVSAKSGGGGGKATTFYKDENDVVRAIKCFYHQAWMSPEVIEFGAKASSATGLNTMCKDGVSKWTKQQRDFKKGKEEILDMVTSGDLAPGDIPAKVAELEEAKDTIHPMEDEALQAQCYDTLEACLAAQGIELPAAE